MRLAEEFVQFTGGTVKVITEPAAKETYSRDIGDVPLLMTRTLFDTTPSFVVQPTSVEEIEKVLAFAGQRKVPVIARGAASWGFGGVIPTRAGIVLDLSPFRRILDLDVSRKTVTVEAGARWSDIDIFAKLSGLCLMTYPSSKFSTVGGWLSTGGYGINSYRYGHLSRQVTAMKVVTPADGLRTLTPADADFRNFVSTEGECGIIVEITLQLREVPRCSLPHLLYFADDESAFVFVRRLAESRETQGIRPNVIRFLDANHLHDANEVLHVDLFKETAGVLVEFSDAEEDERFRAWLAPQGPIDEAPGHSASYSWNERLFGMKTKRLGPTILASEVIIPLERAAAFIARAKKVGDRFGVEISIDSYILDAQRALVMTTFLCDSRRLKYYVTMPLVSALTLMAVDVGAAPYGLGLWNAPFVHHLYDRKRLAELAAFKAKVDPQGILNPGKFFKISSKWLSLPAVVFRPAIFSLAMRLLILVSPLLGPLVVLLLGKEKRVTKLDIELSTHACAKCGNCIAVCPSYLITRNEAVTAKGKLALAQKFIAGREVTREEAENAFLCMHCKACQEICQTNLENMALWDALEESLAKKFGRPEEKIKAFLQAMDKSTEYWEMVERNAMDPPVVNTKR